MFQVESGFHSTLYWNSKLPEWLLLAFLLAEKAELRSSKFCVFDCEALLLCWNSPEALPFSSTFLFSQFIVVPILWRSVRPLPCVLFALPTKLNFCSPRKELTFRFPLYRSCVP